MQFIMTDDSHALVANALSLPQIVQWLFPFGKAPTLLCINLLCCLTLTAAWHCA